MGSYFNILDQLHRAPLTADDFAALRDRARADAIMRLIRALEGETQERPALLTRYDDVTPPDESESE